MNPLNFIKKAYIRITGYSYTHLGRMFLRMYTGLMLMQLSTRQLMAVSAPELIAGNTLGSAWLIAIAVIDIVCAFLFMAGFFTRLMILPPLVIMIIAQIQLALQLSYAIPFPPHWEAQIWLPTMFIGIFLFMLLVGPGKISIDYFLSLHFIHKADRSEEEELEEV